MLATEEQAGLPRPPLVRGVLAMVDRSFLSCVNIKSSLTKTLMLERPGFLVNRFCFFSTGFMHVLYTLWTFSYMAYDIDQILSFMS